MWIAIIALVFVLIVIFLVKNKQSSSTGSYTKETLEKMPLEELDALRLDLITLLVTYSDDLDSEELPAGFSSYGKTLGEAKQLFALVKSTYENRGGL